MHLVKVNFFNITEEISVYLCIIPVPGKNISDTYFTRYPISHFRSKTTIHYKIE